MIKAKNIQLRQIKEKSFKKYRNKIVDLIKINGKSQHQKFFEENKRYSEAIWQGIHDITYSKKSNRINTPSSLLIEGNTITEFQDISEHFNNFFTSIGKDLHKNIAPTKNFLDYLKTPNTDTFHISPTTPKGISDFIKTLKNSESLGANSIPANIIKEIHETISMPLSILINKSFTTGVFSNMCKIAKAVSIFKSETSFVYNNYRPISVLSNIGKIIEKLIRLRLNLLIRSCYYLFQFGFRLNFSTNNALMSIAENIQTQLDDGKYSAGVFFDLKKPLTPLTITYYLRN